MVTCFEPVWKDNNKKVTPDLTQERHYDNEILIFLAARCNDFSKLSNYGLSAERGEEYSTGTLE